MPTFNLNAGAVESPIVSGHSLGAGGQYAALQVVRADSSTEPFHVKLQISLNSEHWDDLADAQEGEVGAVQPFIRIPVAQYRLVHESGAGVIARLE